MGASCCILYNPLPGGCLSSVTLTPPRSPLSGSNRARTNPMGNYPDAWSWLRAGPDIWTYETVAEVALTDDCAPWLPESGIWYSPDDLASDGTVLNAVPYSRAEMSSHTGPIEMHRVPPQVVEDAYDAFVNEDASGRVAALAFLARPGAFKFGVRALTTWVKSFMSSFRLIQKLRAFATANSVDPWTEARRNKQPVCLCILLWLVLTLRASGPPHRNARLADLAEGQ